MCGAAGGSHHRVARVKRWTAHDFHKGVQDQERSDKSLGGSQKKHTGHDLAYWKYNLRPIITPKSFLTHIHRLSSKKKKAHTPDHTIARYNHCSVCKQCCPGTAVSGSYSVRILQSFVFYFQSMRGLIRERARLDVVIEHAQREQKHEVRNGRGDFCSVDCDLPHLEHIRGQSGSTNEEKNVIRHSRWRRQHKQYRWYW